MIIHHWVLGMVEDYLRTRFRSITPSLNLLITTRKRLIRTGLWWRLPTIPRALTEAVIAYMRRGGRVKSHKLLEMVKEALIKALALVLARKLKLVAYLIGRIIADKVKKFLGKTLNHVETLIAGIQWLNTPTIYRHPT